MELDFTKDIFGIPSDRNIRQTYHLLGMKKYEYLSICLEAKLAHLQLNGQEHLKKWVLQAWAFRLPKTLCNPKSFYVKNRKQPTNK